jgi:hypothetical protein
MVDFSFDIHDINSKTQGDLSLVSEPLIFVIAPNTIKISNRCSNKPPMFIQLSQLLKSLINLNQINAKLTGLNHVTTAKTGRLISALTTLGSRSPKTIFMCSDRLVPPHLK